jgi:hypothetical protein
MNLKRIIIKVKFGALNLLALSFILDRILSQSAIPSSSLNNNSIGHEKGLRLVRFIAAITLI